VFPAVALTQVATRVKLVEARSGYIVLNTQFPWVELHVAWVSNQWFENFAVRLFDVQLGLQLTSPKSSKYQWLSGLNIL
jgi:hypothetical protein